MKDSDLERLRNNYSFIGDCTPLVESLLEKYPYELLNNFLCDHCFVTKDDIFKATKALEDDVLFMGFGEDLGLESLFGNYWLIFDTDDVVNRLLSNAWIVYYCKYNPQRSSDSYKVIDYNIFCKGSEWNKCPEEIKKHFEDLQKGLKSE